MAETFAALGDSLNTALGKLALMALAFALLALAVKGRGAFEAARRSAGETRLNLVYFLTDAAAVGPLAALAVTGIDSGLSAAGLDSGARALWDAVPAWLVLLAAVAVSDFVGYWRHRMMHVGPLWAAHAIHHSDREMTWLALARFHPLNRLITTAFNMTALILLGFPVWAIVLNGILRNWYGHYLHADLPWTYGEVLGRIFVSPVQHRWHHVRDAAQSGRNFSTIFALWDVMFGTWHCPRTEVGPLGIEDAGFPESWAGQIAWPFVVWTRSLGVLTLRDAARGGSSG